MASDGSLYGPIQWLSASGAFGVAAVAFATGPDIPLLAEAFIAVAFVGFAATYMNTTFRLKPNHE